MPERLLGMRGWLLNEETSARLVKLQTQINSLKKANLPVPTDLTTEWSRLAHSPHQEQYPGQPTLYCNTRSFREICNLGHKCGGTCSRAISASGAHLTSIDNLISKSQPVSKENGDVLETEFTTRDKATGASVHKVLTVRKGFLEEHQKSTK